MDEYLQLVLFLHSKHIHLREDVKKKSQFNQVTLQHSYKVETSQMSNKKKHFSHNRTTCWLIIEAVTCHNINLKTHSPCGSQTRERNSWTRPFRLREVSLHLVPAIVHISATSSSSISGASKVFSRISFSSYTQDKALCVCVFVYTCEWGGWPVLSCLLTPYSHPVFPSPSAPSHEGLTQHKRDYG